MALSATNSHPGPTQPIVRPSPQRYRKTSTVEISSAARHREVVQLAKRVRVYPAAGRRQGCVCPYLGCRESRPQTASMRGRLSNTRKSRTKEKHQQNISSFNADL